MYIRDVREVEVTPDMGVTPDACKIALTEASFCCSTAILRTFGVTPTFFMYLHKYSYNNNDK